MNHAGNSKASENLTYMTSQTSCMLQCTACACASKANRPTLVWPLTLQSLPCQNKPLPPILTKSTCVDHKIKSGKTYSNTQGKQQSVLTLFLISNRSYSAHQWIPHRAARTDIISEPEPRGQAKKKKKLNAYHFKLLILVQKTQQRKIKQRRLNTHFVQVCVCVHDPQSRVHKHA